MIIDTSALVAILKREPEGDTFAQALDSADCSRISASTYVELSVVVDRWNDPATSRRIDELIEKFRIVIEPVTAEQAKIARQAYRDFGKGSGHPAGLNFGDCFSYAVARDKREPMLWKGDDFGQTDLGSVIGER